MLRLLVGGLFAALMGCGGDGEVRDTPAGGQGGGGGADVGQGGSGGLNRPPPGMPTVTQVSTFDSKIFRLNATLVELADGRVLVAGGRIRRSPPGGGTARATGREEIEIFDVANGTYVEVAPLKQGRIGASSVLLPDGKVLITGGFGGPPGEVPVLLDSAEIFDPATNDTTLRRAMNTARAYHGSWLLSSGANAGKVLIAGGGTASAPEVYDPATGMFTPLGAANGPPGGVEYPVLLDDEQVVFIGTPSDLPVDDRGYHRYDPEAGIFDDLGLFTSRGRSRYTVTKLHDGRVLIAGGVEGNEGLADLDVFDPSDNSIAPTGQLLEGRRYLHSAAVLPSGRVALISGFRAIGESLATVAIWDPETGTVSDAAGEVFPGRANSQALTLSSGQIFVIGGEFLDRTGNLLSLPNIDLISE
ncbi:MAG: Kelch repeat-containing protein [Deltaproteobacteria bacterium]